MTTKPICVVRAPLITAWRESTGFLRATTGVILFFFLWLNVHPDRPLPYFRCIPL